MTDHSPDQAREAACIIYPNEWQEPERTAFCDGAAFALSPSPAPAQQEGLQTLNLLFRAAWELCDDTEGTPVKDSDGEECLLVPKRNWDLLSAALDAVEATDPFATRAAASGSAS